jgi:transposase InsO family protein
MNMHLDINSNTIRTQASRVIFVSTYLRDRAFEWFEPILREYYSKAPDDWGNATREIFSETNGYEKFQEYLNKTFGDVDATRTAERKLRHLRQKTSAVAYASEFQQTISHLDWDEEAYVAIFEDGLQEEVKDELIKVDRPTELSRMIELAVKIDNRLYERRRERDNTRRWRQLGQKYYPKNRSNFSQSVTTRSDDPYGPKPMDLDAIRNQKMSPQERDYRQKQQLCFYCGQNGHMIRECPKKQNNGQRNMGYRPQNQNFRNAPMNFGRNIGRPNHELRAIQEESPRKQVIQEEIRRPNQAHIIAATQTGRHLQFATTILNTTANVLLDSGATGDFIDPNFKNEIGVLEKPKRNPTIIRGLNGDEFEAIVDSETEKLPMTIQNHSENITFDVTPLGAYDIVLGIPWLRRHNPSINWKTGEFQFNRCQCIRSNPNPRQQWRIKLEQWTPQTQEDYYEALQEHDDPEYVFEIEEIAAITQEKPQEKSIPMEHQEFQELFPTRKETPLPEHGPHDHEIPIQPGKDPKYMPLYQLSEPESEVLRTYVNDNLRKGHIRHSFSPAGYPVLFVPKKDGKLRLCVDYRQLNSITIKDRHPLPLISEIQDRIRGSKWFTKLDIADAYTHIRIREGDEWKTAFRTKYGHFEYLIMPFGLTNAPASFQRFINEVLGDILDIFVIAYLDDILIFSKTKEQHIEHVNAVLQKLLDAKIQLRLKKCEFHVQETDFLGHRITQEGIQTEQNKVLAIQEWPIPTNLRELQQFVGMINYYRRYINNYADGMAPLFQLLKKQIPFIWTEKQQKAFEEAKNKLTTAPLLAQHDPEKETTIETDASDYAIGARMTQPGSDDKPKPIAFYSRKLIQAELNYDIHDKELLAIVTAFRVWRPYLEGAKHTIIVKTDHKNLTYFTTTKELTRRQARWSEILSQYDFRIIHCSGPENGQADALSRRPDHEIVGKTIEPAILKTSDDGSIIYNHHMLAATIEVIEDPILAKLIEATQSDEMIQSALDFHDSKLTTDDKGLAYFHGLIYTPKAVREEIIEKHHDNPLSGHMGVEKTLEQVSRNYYFPNMRRKVEKYIKNCTICQQDKPSRHLPYGNLQSIQAPTKPWEWVTIDFIVKLPISSGFDSITVITDRLTKYIHLIPSKETMDAPELAHLFLTHIIANHGVPKYIISDRDKLFTSKFWKSLSDLMGIDHRLSTAYHPQTNGQTERTNQTIEQYLRHYVNYRQDNWAEFLPLAQFAFNNAIHLTIKETPFFANYGYHPTLMAQPFHKEQVANEADSMIKSIQNLHSQLSYDIDFLNIYMAKYYDRKHQKGPDFKKGEKVFLLQRNIRTKRPSRKLDHLKLGPFIIEEKIGRVNYRLQLPESMKRIYPVFHISLLEPAPKNAPVSRNIIQIEDDTEEYEVEKILDSKVIDHENYYLVKWKGYDTSENTWEPDQNLNNCSRLLREFLWGP